MLENAVVRNLAVENCSIESRTSGGLYAGGIAGKMQNSLIEDCYVSGRIVINGETAYSAGGIAGAVFQNGDGENVEIVNNISRCVSNVVVDVEYEQGESGSLAGYVEDTALVENCYSLVDSSELFGSEDGGGHSCERLSKDTWGNENRYIGFDFENVWKITDGGARLIGQDYDREASVVMEDEKPENFENGEEQFAEEANVSAESDNAVDEEKIEEPEPEQEEEDAENGIEEKVTVSDELTSGDFTYQLSGGNVTITGYKGSGSEVSVPERIGENTVTVIGGRAFSSNASIVTVNLPSTIMRIEGSAFSGCSSLAALAIPERVEYLGYTILSGTKVTSIKIPKNVTSVGTNGDDGPLAGANALKKVEFEDGMKRIPNSMCSVGNGKASYVNEVKLPADVEVIGYEAFQNCTGITEVVYPKTLTEVGSYAYSGCSSLESVKFTYNETIVETEGKPYSTIVRNGAYEKCTKLERVELTENITRIEGGAFSGCSSLAVLAIPERVEYLGYTILSGTKVTSIKIPKNVTSVGTSGDNGPLAGANALKEVVFEEGLEKIPSYMCSTSNSYTSYITKAVIPESVTAIGDYAFNRCDNITIYGYKNSYAESYAITESIPFVSVAIAKNASANDVINQLDINHLINSISFAGNEIQGPTVTIAGKTFSLFTIPASMEIALGDKVQAKVDEDKKLIQVMIGFDDFEGSAKLDPNSNKTAYWSESYKQVKSLYTGITGKQVTSTELWNKFSKLRGRLKKMNCNLGINASASAAGYLEFSYASGEITYSSGGVVLEAAIGADMEYKLPPCPAVYVTFGVNAGFKGKLSLVREQTMNYTPAMNTSIDLSANLGVGAGSKKAKTYAELGLIGTLGMNVKLPADSLSDALLVNLSAYAYFESAVFGFNGPDWGPEEFASVQLYPRSSKAALFGGQDLVDFDLDKAEPMDRSYINAPTPHILETSGNTIFSKANLYRYNTPQLARLDNGTLFLAWVDDNGEKNDANKTSLMFSVYDGSEWSEAKAIAETEGANDYPYICTDGQKVQIVWQKAAQMPAGTTLTDVLESVELYTVTWQDGKLSDASPLTSGNQTYEMMQSAAINGNSMAVAWAENSANNPFQAEGTNTIKLSRYASGRWEESTLASSLEEVANLNVAYVGNEPVVTYEASGDNGNVIHLVRENAEKTFTGSCAEMAGGILYYNDGSSLKAYDISTGLTEKVMDTALGDFTVIDDGINRVIISTEYNGLASELVSYTFDQSTGKWSDQVTLTDAGKYIRDYSAVMDKNGCLSAALNLVDTDENSAAIYGNAQLCVMDFADLEDLIIGESVYYDQAALEPGGQLPLNFAVTNNGAKPISQFHVEILDEAGTVLQSGQVSCEAGVGEAAEVSYTYTLPSVIQNQTLTLKIYTDNETKLSDNTASVELGLADIAIGSMYLSGNSTAAVLKGQITNIGWQDAQPVTVTVYDTHENGGMVGTAQLGSLPQGESKDFEIAVAQAYLDVNPLANGNTLYVSAVTDSSEMDYANNSDYYLIQSATDAPLVLNSGSVVLDENGTGQLEVVYSSLLDVKTETITWTSSDDSVVTVIDGKLTAVGEGQAVVTAVIKGYTVSATVKVDGGVPVTGIYLEENTVNMLAGSSRKLTANVLPANASNKKVLWESTDTSIAEVSADGTVTAKGIGTAAVEAHTEDGYKTASCKVTVSQAADTIYTVTFSGGEGSSGRWPAALTGTARTVVTLPENTYTKAGYVFIGWSDGENTLEAGSAYRIPYRSMELTAVWNEVPKKEYTITASSQAGGSISPDGETTVEEGESQTYTITPDQGYHIGDVKVDGESAGALSEYTFENVTANHTIEALFNKDESVKIEKITLSQTEASLKKGETLKLEAVVTPDTAADKQLKWSSDNVQTASVDNGLVTAIGKGTAVITAESQDGSHVSASCRVTVAEDQVPEGGQKYTITSSCNEGGSISPAGKTEVPEGEDKKYTITPDQGYHIQDVKADGISIGAVTEYTFEKVAGDHTIEAFFEKDEPAGNEKKEQKMSVKPGKLVFTAGGKAQTLKVSGARGILTYISSNPKVVKPSKTGKMTPLAAGKAVITIKASGDEEYKAKTIKVKAEVFPKKPAQVKKVKAAPAKAKRTAKVTWKKTSASGYQIQYAYSKKVGKGKTIKVPKGKSVSKTIKKLKSRKYVYVRVRAYNTKAGLTSYGKWSKTIRSRKKIR